MRYLAFFGLIFLALMFGGGGICSPSRFFSGCFSSEVAADTIPATSRVEDAPQLGGENPAFKKWMSENVYPQPKADKPTTHSTKKGGHYSQPMTWEEKNRRRDQELDRVPVTFWVVGGLVFLLIGFWWYRRSGHHEKT